MTLPVRLHSCGMLTVRQHKHPANARKAAPGCRARRMYQQAGIMGCSIMQMQSTLSRNILPVQ